MSDLILFLAIAILDSVVAFGLWTNHEQGFSLNFNKFVAGWGYDHSREHIPTQAVSTRAL
jgi:hypothetical protein